MVILPGPCHILDSLIVYCPSTFATGRGVERADLQRNRENCLAAFIGRIAVKLLISPPQSSLVFYTRLTERPPAHLTMLSLQTVHSLTQQVMEGACVTCEACKPCSPSSFAPFPPFPLPKHILAFLVVLQIWGWSQEKKVQDSGLVCRCLHACREGRFLFWLQRRITEN